MVKGSVDLRICGDSVSPRKFVLNVCQHLPSPVRSIARSTNYPRLSFLVCPIHRRSRRYHRGHSSERKPPSISVLMKMVFRYYHKKLKQRAFTLSIDSISVPSSLTSSIARRDVVNMSTQIPLFLYMYAIDHGHILNLRLRPESARDRDAQPHCAVTSRALQTVSNPVSILQVVSVMSLDAVVQPDTCKSRKFSRNPLFQGLSKCHVCEKSKGAGDTCRFIGTSLCSEAVTTIRPSV